MRALTKLLSAAAAVVIGTAAAVSAQAAVYIGLGAVPVTQVDSDPSADNAVFVGSSGVFTFNVVSGSSGIYPTLLNSQALNTTSSGAGSLDIWVTRTDISGPLAGFRSGFTTNFLPKGWSVLEETYVDLANGLYAGVLAGTATFLGDPNVVQGDTDLFNLATGEGLFSVTHHYRITATGAGQNNSTISLAAVPEPGAWALMILGFAGAGAMLRSRRREIAFA